ncbi:class I SAM-dependent methyltransferase [Paraburkholderia metrosideri]|nr:class I SAM-dependent methyltransferase [Paraburkholderia metrosideri]
MADYSTLSGSSGAIGGATQSEAEVHFVGRFLNSAVRAQYVCSDPMDSEPEIRDMILDQMADGRIFLLDLGAGNGAGTLAILALLRELRGANCIPQLPLNVHIFGVDYSTDALALYSEMLEELEPWLAMAGISIELECWPCDLRVVGDFSELLDVFFDDAKSLGTKRFLCVISALTGLGKDGMEEIHKSLEAASIRLSHKARESSWLWIEPTVSNNWFTMFISTIMLSLKKIPYIFSKKKDSFEVKTSLPLLPTPVARKILWQDPYLAKINTSHVVVVGFKND